MDIPRRLRIAAVQFTATQSPAQNRARAESLIEFAARGEAQLVLLPELFTTPYRLDETLWAAGERLEGPTLAWMRRTARSSRLWIGGSFVETDGGTSTIPSPSSILRARCSVP